MKPKQVSGQEINDKATELLDEGQQKKFVKLSAREKFRMMRKAKNLYNSFCIDCRIKVFKNNGDLQNMKEKDFCGKCWERVRSSND